MQDLSETLNGIITSGRRSDRFSWIPALDFGFIVFYRDGRPGFRSSAAPSGRARRAGSQSRLEDHSCRAHNSAASRSLSAWKILPFTYTDASTFRQWTNRELVCLIHGDVSGKQSGISSVPPQRTPIIPFFSTLSLWTSLYSPVTDLVPPLT